VSPCVKLGVVQPPEVSPVGINPPDTGPPGINPLEDGPLEINALGGPLPGGEPRIAVLVREGLGGAGLGVGFTDISLAGGVGLAKVGFGAEFGRRGLRTFAADAGNPGMGCLGAVSSVGPGA